MVKTLHPAEYLEDAKIYLEDPTDYQSQLIFPAVVLYPTTNEFDFIAEISELTTPNDILAMVLDRPQSWFEDPKHAKFTIRNLDCYMETTSGGLVKVGKKVAINEALMGEKAKAPLFDNGLRLFTKNIDRVHGLLLLHGTKDLWCFCPALDVFLAPQNIIF